MDLGSAENRAAIQIKRKTRADRIRKSSGRGDGACTIRSRMREMAGAVVRPYFPPCYAYLGTQDLPASCHLRQDVGKDRLIWWMPGLQNSTIGRVIALPYILKVGAVLRRRAMENARPTPQPDMTRAF